MGPTVLYPVVAPWKLEWPVVDWCLDLKRRGQGRVDLVEAFRYCISKGYSDFTLVYTDGPKDPETGVTGYEVAVPDKRIEINSRHTSI